MIEGEAEAGVGLVGDDPGPVGRAAEAAAGVPGAALLRPPLPRRRAEPVLPPAAPAIVRAVPVVAPLPDLPVHVIQAQGVRLVAAHLAGAPQAGQAVGAAEGVLALEIGLPAVEGGGRRRQTERLGEAAAPA